MSSKNQSARIRSIYRVSLLQILQIYIDFSLDFWDFITKLGFGGNTNSCDLEMDIFMDKYSNFGHFLSLFFGRMKCSKRV